MLYYIVPPLIIISGLAILVSFLFKKINQIPEDELEKIEGSPKIEKLGMTKKVSDNLSQFSLKILERMIQRFKLSSLKFHNVCQNWFQSIRKRREERLLAKKERMEAEKNIAQIEEDAQREKEIEKPQISEEIKSTVRTRIIKAEEIKTSPMISKKVVLPEQMEAVVKNHLEEALIERIATNPQDIEAYERLGDYYMEQANYRESLECFKHVLKLSPVHRKAKIRVRRLERMLGR